MLAFRSLAVALAASSPLLSTAGCAGFNKPSYIYSTTPPGMASQHPADDKPLVTGQDDVRSTFKALVAGCSRYKRTDPLVFIDASNSAYDSWAKSNEASAECANYVIAYAIDQCVVKTGTQNVFAATANYALGGALIVGGLAADVAAIANSKSSNAVATAALATAITSGATNVQKLIPTNTPIAISTLIVNGQSYVSLSAINDTEWCNTKSGICVMTKEAALAFSRLHDAVLAGCPASGY